jgi:hypothetical protein
MFTSAMLQGAIHKTRFAGVVVRLLFQDMDILSKGTE